jgi:predicted negative regulator of RcsB-dependent stress response
MPTASPVTRDPGLDVHVFWYRFKTEIGAVIVIALLALIGFGGYRIYCERRNSAASTLLASAKTAQDYEQVIARYPNAPAGATAYLLLAQAQRDDHKLMESNATLQIFIDKNPDHELVSTARMAMAANLESMGKMDEALSTYQRVAADYPKSYNAPLALVSQVPILKAKNQNDAARRICETILTQYRDSFWSGEAMRELRSLKPAGPTKPPGTSPMAPFSVPSPSQPRVRPPMALPSAAAPSIAPTAKP